MISHKEINEMNRNIFKNLKSNKHFTGKNINGLSPYQNIVEFHI